MSPSPSLPGVKQSSSRPAPGSRWLGRNISWHLAPTIETFEGASLLCSSTVVDWSDFVICEVRSKDQQQSAEERTRRNRRIQNLKQRSNSIPAKRRNRQQQQQEED
ncbi:unnamed protein product [Calypogeia fissa]